MTSTRPTTPEDVVQGSQYTVSDVMTGKVVALAGDATFKEIVRTMRRWRVSALPVLDGDGHVTGVVSEADLLHKEESRDSGTDRSVRSAGSPGAVRARAVTARNLATTPAVTVHADATLAAAAGLMAHGAARPAPGPLGRRRGGRPLRDHDVAAEQRPGGMTVHGRAGPSPWRVP
ncbi:CBS domain-containing protein [Streptomyces sp. NPDC006743]|uniref:CBS domain-containing protein n=1 Tax=Streptomyces sp. NPDC006743 TaxID=3154480 RepID=UPI003452E301